MHSFYYASRYISCLSCILTNSHKPFEKEKKQINTSGSGRAVFSFLYLKKIKFQKYMSVLKYFKNIPRSPSHRATGPKCIFFFQICNEVPGEKKTSPVARWGATGACRPAHGRPPLGPAHGRGRGPVAPPAGDRGYPLYKLKPSPSLLI